jgi:hypothetical protein
MSNCTNPECLCQGVEPMDFRKLSGRDMDQRFGMASSRIVQAVQDIAYLSQMGAFEDDQSDHILADLARANERLQTQHVIASKRVGFTIRGGIGPNDWKNK